MVNRGHFITFEGGEGAGKTTLISRVEGFLAEQGHRVIRTREPGGTPGAEDIRRLLVTGAANRWDAVSETALFLTARRHHLQELIEPALAAGNIVLCDRFMDSTLVYQGIAKNLGLSFVRELSHLIVGDITPNQTFLLDIDPQIGLARTAERSGAEQSETRFESHTLDFHHAIREGFLLLAQQSPERIEVLDASQPADAILQQVQTSLHNLKLFPPEAV